MKQPSASSGTGGTLVRPATPEDAPALAALQRRSVRFSFAGFYSDDVKDRFCRGITEDRFQVGSGRPERVVAMGGGVPVGFGSLREDGQVAGIYVDPEAQGSGAGRVLLEAVEQLARSRGMKALELNATLNAVGFYERMGFAPSARVDQSVGEGATMQLMRMTKKI